MKKNNIHRDKYEIDEFDNQYAYPNKKSRQLKERKHMAKKKMREKNKRQQRGFYDDDEE